jgi:hypothetical protein
MGAKSMNREQPRVIGRPFRPGQSGNPGGRPKSLEHIRSLARDNSVRALERLIELIESDDPRVAIVASKEVLDRAFGKPTPASEKCNEPVHIQIVRMSDIKDEPRVEGNESTTLSPIVNSK